MWLLDKCDSCGVVDPDWDLASFQIGLKVAPEMLEDFSGRITRLDTGKLFIPNFIKFQYGKLSPACKPHLKVFAALEEHKLDPEGINQNESFSEKVNMATRAAIIARDGLTCVYYDTPLAESDVMIDHIVPKSRGGQAIHENLVVASASANLKKRDFSVDEFCQREGLDFAAVCKRISARIGKPFGPAPHKPKGYLGTLEEENIEEEARESKKMKMEEYKLKDEKRTNITQPELNVTSTTASILNGIEAKIQSLKPEWRIALTYAEQTCLKDNLRSVESITDEDWAILRDFLAAKLDKAEGFWQPWSRSKFVETIGDVHISALRWASKNRRVRKEGWK